MVGEADDLMFEDDEKPFNIRHRCYHFAKDLVHFTLELEYKPVFRSIIDQLIRSGTSIGANAVEGSAGSSKKDFVNFYLIALKSANECKFWLCLVRDTLQCDKMKINKLLKEVCELSSIIGSIVTKAKQP